MERQEEKTGVLKRVAPSTGGLVFEDEPDVWYNATKTAKNYVKADLKGKKVTLRLADKPRTFSFISLSPDQSAAPKEQGVKSETVMTKDDYWARKEKRDIIKDEQISRHGAINTALEVINASIKSGSETTMKPEDILPFAAQLAESIVLPFVKGIAKNNTSKE